MNNYYPSVCFFILSNPASEPFIFLPLLMYSYRKHQHQQHHTHLSTCWDLHHHHCHQTGSANASIQYRISHYAELYMCVLSLSNTLVKQTERLFSTSSTLRHTSTTCGLMHLNKRLVFSCCTLVTIKQNYKQCDRIWERRTGNKVLHFPREAN